MNRLIKNHKGIFASVLSSEEKEEYEGLLTSLMRVSCRPRGTWGFVYYGR